MEKFRRLQTNSIVEGYKATPRRSFRGHTKNACGGPQTRGRRKTSVNASELLPGQIFEVTERFLWTPQSYFPENLSEVIEKKNQMWKAAKILPGEVSEVNACGRPQNYSQNARGGPQNYSPEKFLRSQKDACADRKTTSCRSLQVTERTPVEGHQKQCRREVSEVTEQLRRTATLLPEKCLRSQKDACTHLKTTSWRSFQGYRKIRLWRAAKPVHRRSVTSELPCVSF